MAERAGWATSTAQIYGAQSSLFSSKYGAQGVMSPACVSVGCASEWVSSVTNTRVLSLRNQMEELAAEKLQ